MNTIDGQDGLYEVNQAMMPHGPERYWVPRYILTASYGHVESEEAAAHYILLCQELGGWFGISAPRFCTAVGARMIEMERGAAERSAAVERIWQEYNAKFETYQRDLAAWKRRNLLTLGLRGRSRTKPVEPAQPDFSEVREDDLGISAVMMWGAPFLMSGLRELVEGGYIRVERDSESDWDVMFPEPKLLDPLDQYLIPA